MPEPIAPRVFISYSHDSPEHEDRVLDLAERLRVDGVDASIDQYEVLPPEGWPTWCDKEIRKADLVLMVCTKTYFRRVNGEEQLGKGYGVLWEARLIKQELYDSGSVSSKFVPVLLGGAKTEHIPRPVGGTTFFRPESPDGYNALYRFVTKQPLVKKPELGTLRRLPEREWRSFGGGSGNPAPQRFVTSSGTRPALAISNVPIGIPLHFLGRDDVLAEMHTILSQRAGRVAITALHGLRGVGKTVLAAAYAEEHSGEYRIIWWVRAETELTMRSDLTALAVRLGWAAPDDTEELALNIVLQGLRQAGEGVLLIFDNATDAETIRPCLPRGGDYRAIITSNSPAWRGVAQPVEIRVWTKETGSDYLIRRTGRKAEREAAGELSSDLGGLPLAHEQAAAYCERLDIALSEYRLRFEKTPARMLDTERDAPAEYHDRRTVAKTFALAIDEASKINPAAEAVIVHAALLPPEPIPLYLFTDARKKIGTELETTLNEYGLDEAIAALRTFALIDRETITVESDPRSLTNTIRLHRLVREVAIARQNHTETELARRALMDAMAEVYPREAGDHPETSGRARLLDPLALALISTHGVLPVGAELSASTIMNSMVRYRVAVLGAYGPPARSLCERALELREQLLGADHPETAETLNNLGNLLEHQGKPREAELHVRRALKIREKVFGPAHVDTAESLGLIGQILQTQGKLTEAQRFLEQALGIFENALGTEHTKTATCLNGLAAVLEDQMKFSEAHSLIERALAINESILGPEHPSTAATLNNLAETLRRQRKFADAEPLVERALAILEKKLGPEHHRVGTILNNFAQLLQNQGKLAEARPLLERALAINEKALGPEHLETAMTLSNLGLLLFRLGNLVRGRLMVQRAVAMSQKALGPKHPTAVGIRRNLAAITSHRQQR